MPHQNIKTPRFYPLKNLEIATTSNLLPWGLKFISGSQYFAEFEDYGQPGDTYKSDYGNSFANFTPYQEKKLDVMDSQESLGIDIDKFILGYSTGVYNDWKREWSLNPSQTMSFLSPEQSVGFDFFGILGHNFSECNAMVRVNAVKRYWDFGKRRSEEPLEMSPIMNCSKHTTNTGKIYMVGTNEQVEYTGTPAGTNKRNGSMLFNVTPDCSSGYSRFFELEIVPIDDQGFTDDVKLGSLVWGKKYDMPHSPDLSYSMNVEYDGIKSKKTVGGSTISDIAYYKRGMFSGQYEGFGSELEGNTSITGRRSWKMNFSALKSEWTDSYEDTAGYLFPKGYNNNAEFRYGNDFYNRVMNVSLGGQLPFIWEYDTTVLEENTNVDQWAVGEHNENHFVVARFPKNSVSFKHKSFKFFDISMEIEESW